MSDVIDVFWGQNSTICDCCGVLNQYSEVYMLDRGCNISLCRECIVKFYALLNAKPATIIRLGEIQAKQNNNKKNADFATNNTKHETKKGDD